MTSDPSKATHNFLEFPMSSLLVRHGYPGLLPATLEPFLGSPGNYRDIRIFLASVLAKRFEAT